MFQVINRMREMLLDSDRDIGVLINSDFFKKLEEEYSFDEVHFSLKYLIGKGHLDYYPGGGYQLTSEGYDEWLFPSGPIDEKSVFLSYAVEDKILAGKLKKVLEESGLRVFLAHEDIEPTAKWRDKIISDLKASNVFLVLRTKNYIGKQYTEQECGFALALGKRILSLSIDTKSSEMGFLSEFQGAAFKAGEEEKIFAFCIKQLVK